MEPTDAVRLTGQQGVWFNDRREMFVSGHIMVEMDVAHLDGRELIRFLAPQLNGGFSFKRLSSPGQDMDDRIVSINPDEKPDTFLFLAPSNLDGGVAEAKGLEESPRLC